MGTVSDGTSMKCDVVNGGYDQKAYLLVPPQNEMLVKKELEDYKTKVFPFAQGEARFRETIGLPPVIHISTKVKQCLEVFDRLTPAQVWQRAPDSVRQATSSQFNYNEQNRNNHSSISSAELQVRFRGTNREQQRKSQTNLHLVTQQNHGDKD